MKVVTVGKINNTTGRQIQCVNAPATRHPICVVICVVIDDNTCFYRGCLAAKGRAFHPVADRVVFGEK